MATPLLARHIQDFSEANITLRHHWGYPSRVLPCTSDAGTCAYLDAVYCMHDTSMLYTWILWGVLLGIGIIWVTFRGYTMGGPEYMRHGPFNILLKRAEDAKRRWLLPDAPYRSLLGRVSRMQVVTLAVLLGYLLIFSLCGIIYETWFTPVKNSTLHNTRTGLGGFADRVGAFAYALTPFTILLSNRESVLSLLTGIPYQHFSFLHRWTGYIIFAQAFLHTLGWTIVEARLYQPQPEKYASLMAEQYIIFGVVAMFLLTLMLLMSTRRAIKWFGYEVFKASHWCLAVLYIGMCWGHWDKLWCWMVASLCLIAIDQAVRAGGMLHLHLGGSKGGGQRLQGPEARQTLFGEEDDVVIRLDFDHTHRQPWQAGQHFHICFPSLSIWQSHPYTTASLPDPNGKVQRHTYLLRVRKGQTARLAALGQRSSIPTLLTGPYGSSFPSYGAQNVMAVAGGTGITFALPVVLEALRQQIRPRHVVELVWIVRGAEDLLWLADEMSSLKRSLDQYPGLRINIFVTRQSGPGKQIHSQPDEKTVTSAEAEKDNLQAILATDNARFSVTYMGGHHPMVAGTVSNFVDCSTEAGGTIEVVGSGPDTLGSDLRCAVAGVVSGAAVSFYWDSRG